MKIHPSPAAQFSGTLVLTVLLMVAPAGAQTPASEQLARYKQEMALCQSGRSPQARPTCEREARAAYAQAKKGDLDDGPAAYERNAHERCMSLPAPERYECVARMQGQGSQGGSVSGGGISRELRTTVPDKAGQ